MNIHPEGSVHVLVRDVKVGDKLVGRGHGGLRGTVLVITQGVQGWTRGITTTEGTWNARATGIAHREETD
jgi:hypothetical protein